MTDDPAHRERVGEIERCALDAWPASETELCDGWVLRAMAGVSRRANSVWTGGAGDGSSFAARIVRAESFYERRGLPAVFQVSDAQPGALDALLAERGYTVEAPVVVQVAAARLVASRSVASTTQLGALVARVEPQLSAPWFALSGGRGRFANVQPVYRGLLERLGERALFARACIGDNDVAVGLGALGGGWLGISSMFTLPDWRRRGAARAILSSLAEAAVLRGVEALYLQVEDDNDAALTLYRALGFTDHHRYHYRVAPSGA